MMLSNERVWIATSAADPILSLVVLNFPVTHPANLISVFLVLAFSFSVVFKRRSVDSGLAIVIATVTLVYLASLGLTAETVLPMLE